MNYLKNLFCLLFLISLMSCNRTPSSVERELTAFVDTEFQLELRGVTIPYFIDPTGSLKRINRNFPQSESLKIFLTKDNKVLIAGSPVGNPKMAELYLSLLKER